MSEPQVELLFDGSNGCYPWKRFATEVHRYLVFGVSDEDWCYLEGLCVQCDGEGTRTVGDDTVPCDACGGSGELDSWDTSDATSETWDSLINSPGDAFVIALGLPKIDASGEQAIARDADKEGRYADRDRILRDAGATLYRLDQRDGDTFLIPVDFEYDEGLDTWIDPRNTREAIENGVEITVEIEPEFEPIRGNALDSGDAAVDRALEDELIERLGAGDTWAWCMVRVVAEYRGVRVDDTLGCCSYADEQDFRSNSGYFDDMRSNLITEIHKLLNL